MGNEMKHEVKKIMFSTIFGNKVIHKTLERYVLTINEKKLLIPLLKHLPSQQLAETPNSKKRKEQKAWKNIEHVLLISVNSI